MIKSFAVAGAALLLATNANASTLYFDFSYYNSFGSTAAADPGYVTGEIELTCTTSTKCTAAKVMVGSLPGTFSIGESLPYTVTGDVVNNSFTLNKTGNGVTSYDYVDVITGTPSNIILGITLEGGIGTLGGTAGGTAGSVSFKEVAATPITAALPLFAVGLGFIGYLTRRRKKGMQALTAA
jgi:hypothetical protein